VRDRESVREFIRNESLRNQATGIGIGAGLPPASFLFHWKQPGREGEREGERASARARARESESEGESEGESERERERKREKESVICA
jgi:hypothetical protein